MTVQLIKNQIANAKTRNTNETLVTSFNASRSAKSGKSICDLLLVIASVSPRLKLRRPTKVARVAMNGGRPTQVINHACKVPTIAPESRVPINAMTTAQVASSPARKPAGSSTIRSEPNTVALIAITEPLDRSIPPEMMMTAAPSAKNPSKTELRIISSAELVGLLK